MIEVQTGVFAGKVSGLVRDLLWRKCVERGAGGQCCQVWPTDNEQGFGVRLVGDGTRSVVDLDGLLLIGVKGKAGSGPRRRCAGYFGGAEEA